MQFIETELKGAIIIEPKLLEDDRGFFYEFYHREKFLQGGIDIDFVQDNHSSSLKNVLRGLHYQHTRPQGKLVRATYGKIFDVAVDIDPSSPTYKKWVGIELSAENKTMFYIPPGYAHGFIVLSERAEMQYKCSEMYLPEYDTGIRWNDPEIGIDWPLTSDLILSEKDKTLPFLGDA